MSDDQQQASRKRPHDDSESADEPERHGHADVSADDADEDDDDVVHLDELFGEQDALYGASSDSECTYSRGYLSRQPVYACRTCRTDGPAAVCFGCAKRCHDGHDLLELYSKRGLCCDCGNAKFAGVLDPATGEKFACQLCEFKTLNRDNEYNQNFAGLYCVCARPYPDPENPSAEEMLQCAVCEDWYHAGHLKLPEWCSGASLPMDAFDEMVCQLCTARLPYLRCYALSGLPAASDTPDKPSDTSDKPSESSDKPSDSSDKPSDSSHKPSDSSDKPSDSSDKPSGSSDKPSETGSVCALLGRPELSGAPAAALLMPAGWRRRLCRCSSCLAAYARDRAAWLTDPADSLAEFEQANRRAAEEQSRPENVLRSLASAGVPHVSVQLVASAIGDFSRGFTRAMASVLADKNCSEGETAVITRQDADRILAMMAPLLAKRARFQPPDNCRKD